MSFKDIGTIIRRIDGQEDHDIETKDLKNKSTDTKALWLLLLWVINNCLELKNMPRDIEGFFKELMKSYAKFTLNV